MPRETRTVRVEAIPGEPFRFRVESWEQPEFPHTVDLLEWGGHGVCSCTDFGTRCTANFRKHFGQWVEYGAPGRPNPQRTQCKHVCCARRFYLNNKLKSESFKYDPSWTAPVSPANSPASTPSPAR
jgi:hypothetical protein